jgi:isopenicillin-N epimerase
MAADLADGLGTCLGAVPTAFEAMATVRLPLPPGRIADRVTASAVHDRLLHDHQIEIPVMLMGDALWIRLSAQAYNAPADYVGLHQACRAVLSNV